MVAPWHPSLHGPSHDCASRAPPDAGSDRWRIPSTTRGQLLVRACPAATSAWAFSDWISFALGPERVLGHEGSDEHCVHDPCRGSRAATTARWRVGIRSPDTDKIFCTARGYTSRGSRIADSRTHLPVSTSWRHDPQEREGKTGRIFLAGAGTERWRRFTHCDGDSLRARSVEWWRSLRGACRSGGTICSSEA